MSPEKIKKSIVQYGLLSTAQIGLNAHLPASHQSENSEIISNAKEHNAQICLRYH